MPGNESRATREAGYGQAVRSGPDGRAARSADRVCLPVVFFGGGSVKSVFDKLVSALPRLLWSNDLTLEEIIETQDTQAALCILVECHRLAEIFRVRGSGNDPRPENGQVYEDANGLRATEQTWDQAACQLQAVLDGRLKPGKQL